MSSRNSLCLSHFVCPLSYFDSRSFSSTSSALDPPAGHINELNSSSSVFISPQRRWEGSLPSKRLSHRQIDRETVIITLSGITNTCSYLYTTLKAAHPRNGPIWWGQILSDLCVKTVDWQILQILDYYLQQLLIFHLWQISPHCAASHAVALLPSHYSYVFSRHLNACIVPNIGS